MKTLKASEAESVEDAMVVYGVACRFIALKFRIKDEIERLKQFRRWLAQDFKCEKRYPSRCWSHQIVYEHGDDFESYAPEKSTLKWCNACRKTHKVSMRIKRLSHKLSGIDSKLVKILEIKRNRKSVWHDYDYYPEKRLQKAEESPVLGEERPAQNTMEICHTAPNSASTQNAQLALEFGS
jgi:hypothetical protein